MSDLEPARRPDLRHRRATVPLLGLRVGFVLADSAIVTLALPEILRRLDGTVAQVAWVLIAFNLVLQQGTQLELSRIVCVDKTTLISVLDRLEQHI